jgi:hypothetical protein
MDAWIINLSVQMDVAQNRGYAVIMGYVPQLCAIALLANEFFQGLICKKWR